MSEPAHADLQILSTSLADLVEQGAGAARRRRIQQGHRAPAWHLRPHAKFHVGRLLDKLDATGRTDAVAHAARRGAIQL
jgi:hypothetical protein